jgi:uncharacterized protein YecT (DUF1311 family)
LNSGLFCSPHGNDKVIKACFLTPEGNKLQTTKMKIPTLFAAWIALVVMAVPLESKGQDTDFKPPGTEENAAVDQANTRLDAVYKQLMGKLDADGQKALKEAERSWIKWRDDEAMLIARVGGAVGGSGMRVDFANAQLKLVNQRIELLSEYLKQSGRN